jgi:four helix bundle protein
MEKNNIIRSKTFQFSLEIIELYKQLVAKHEFVISKQLLKSATSIGANVREAQAGQSKKDFLTKIYIAFKEANETSYWLELLEKSNFIDTDISSHIENIEEILKILTKIIQTTKTNLQK